MYCINIQIKKVIRETSMFSFESKTQAVSAINVQEKNKIQAQCCGVEARLQICEIKNKLRMYSKAPRTKKALPGAS